MPKNVHFNGQTFSGVVKQVFYSKVIGIKLEKSIFLRKNCFESNFYKVGVYVVTNWPIRLEKKHQTIESLLMVDVYVFLKIFTRLFRDFSRFLKFISSPCSNCYMHFIIWAMKAKHSRTWLVHLWRFKFNDYCILPGSMWTFKKQFDGIMFFFNS